MIDIEELKRKALAAHGGLDAWYTDGQMDDLDPVDAEYVVTASPKTVLALIKRLEAAEQIALRLSELAEQMAYRMAAADRDAQAWRNLAAVRGSRVDECIALLKQADAIAKGKA